MGEEQFQRMEELFHHAEPLAPAAREEFLDRECATDPSLRQRVEDLLRAHETAVEHLDGVVQGGLQWLGEEKPPDHIGPYRVVRQIGEGGFATVYLAERDDGQFTMEVAIKVVRRHLLSPEMQRRLRRERQILAGFDHPHIARIFDGGSTSDGAPYVVMEYVEGLPIDHYCDAKGLDLRQRLELFQRVLEAVQAAHRNLVLHRDIKPSNILVTEEGIPKLLDFGIAKLLRSEEGDSTPSRPEGDFATLTRPGARILTPEYASPEQILGRPLTTATDVYSLGVVLYLLVAGERPYRFGGDRWSEIENVVCEQIPKAPSTKEGYAGRRRLSQDLDTIILKALAKEPEHRYRSVEQLTEDLRRNLEGLPILAHKPSFAYRLSKFVLRHRLAVAAAMVIFCILVSAMGITVWQAREALHARTRAEYVAGFLEGLFETTDPYQAQGRSVTARQVVEQGARRIRSELLKNPRLEADLLATMGRVYRSMALYDEAEDLLNHALQSRRTELGPRHPEVAETLRDLGTVYLDRGDCERARTTFGEARDIEGRRGGEEKLTLATILHYQGQTEMACGDRQAAEELLSRALAIRRRHLGDSDEDTTNTASLLAELWYERGEYDRAGEAFEEILARRRKFLGEAHPNVATSLSDLAAVHQANGDAATAIPLYEEALVLLRQSFGERHGLVAKTLYNLATAYLADKQWQPAGDHLEAALDLVEEVYGEHPLGAKCLNALAGVRFRQGDLEGAERIYQRALALRRSLLGESHPTIAQTLYSLANMLKGSQPERALQLFEETLELQERTLPAGDFRFAYTLIGLGEVRLLEGEPQKAEPFFRRALEIRHGALPTGHWEIAIAEAFLGQSLANQGRLEEAETVLEASLRHMRESVGAEDRRTKRAQERLESLRATFRSSRPGP